MGGYFLGTRAFAAILAVLAAVAVVAGCGSDESSDAASIKTGSLSKEEFVKKADKVCEEGQKRHIAKARAYINDNAKLEQSNLTAELGLEA